tara:strand:+ start:3910 stop:4281 length:372 start_codon:yes stop_codon:yes gene_type:complete
MIINFAERINVSVQIGDLVWFAITPMTGVPGNQYATESNVDNILSVGTVTAINNTSAPYQIEVNGSNPFTNQPTLGSFIMFSKDETVNKSHILGYYANVQLTNNSRKKIELFAVGTEITESSK